MDPSTIIGFLLKIPWKKLDGQWRDIWNTKAA
jgi:hypothetical protein